MQTINLDLTVKGTIPPLYAKQGDVGRKFKVILTDGGVAYTLPVGAMVSVWYSGASGEGNYTDIGAGSAISVSGNEITVEMITQMLSNPGVGVVCLVINTAGGNELGMWNINYCVEPRPGMNSAEAVNYFTAFSQAVANLPYPDASLSVAGKAADAAAVGTALAGKAPAIEDTNHPGCYYRTVQGVTEWLNPPMTVGVEYRTTERFDGKAVYTRLVNCGVATNGASVTMDGLTACLRYIGYISYPNESYVTKPLPIWSGATIGTDYHAEITQPASPYNVSEFVIKTDSISGGFGEGAYTWFVQAWYTKD